MQYIVPILRDAINLQYYCQYLESQNPSLRRMPLRASNFLDLGCQNAKSLKKSRAARAKEDTRHANYQDLALRNARSEDTAKMTHSIVDFVNLGAKYCQYYCQYLKRSGCQYHNNNTWCTAKPSFHTSLLGMPSRRRRCVAHGVVHAWVGQ